MLLQRRGGRRRRSIGRRGWQRCEGREDVGDGSGRSAQLEIPALPNVGRHRDSAIMLGGESGEFVPAQDQPQARRRASAQSSLHTSRRRGAARRGSPMPERAGAEAWPSAEVARGSTTIAAARVPRARAAARGRAERGRKGGAGGEAAGRGGSGLTAAASPGRDLGVKDWQACNAMGRAALTGALPAAGPGPFAQGKQIAPACLPCKISPLVPSMHCAASVQSIRGQWFAARHAREMQMTMMTGLEGCLSYAWQGHGVLKAAVIASWTVLPLPWQAALCLHSLGSGSMNRCRQRRAISLASQVDLFFRRWMQLT